MASLDLACRRRRERQRGQVKGKIGRARGGALEGGSSISGDTWLQSGTSAQQPGQGGIDDELAGEER